MSAFPIARLFGFEVRLHVSWALILAVIGVTVVNRLGDLAPATSPVVRWSLGASVGIAFLLSAIAHELAHAVVARRAGMPGAPVLVYFFGGAASPTLDAERPRDEVASALAGPLTSLVIGALLAGVTAILASAAAPAVRILAQGTFVVAVMNLILGAVNLVPAFPLDGGRVARGIAWARTGDPDRGLRAVTYIGRRLGIAFGVIGLVVVLLVEPVDGLMVALCGWFLVSSARAVERTADVELLLDGIHVEDVMDRDVAGVPPGLTLDTFAEQVLDGSASTTLPVVEGPELIGILGASQVRRVRRSRWPETRVSDLMVAASVLPPIAPGTSLRTALDQLRRSGLDGLPVLDAGALRGVITRRAVVATIQAQMRASGISLR